MLLNKYRSERHKPLPEPIISESMNTNDEEPPPPGEEVTLNAAPNVETQQLQKPDKHLTSPEKEKGSADESKHSKKSRERKKHKKDSRKKKKRDRKDKKSSSSKSNTPEIEDRSMIKRSVSNEQIVEKPLESEVEKEDNLDELILTENESKFDASNPNHSPDFNILTVLDDANFDSKFDEYLVEPELSKWERDESTHNEKNHDHHKNSTTTNNNNNNDVSSGGNSEVTSEIIKRAENAIFAKAVNAIRPQEVNKTSSKNDHSPLSSLVKKVDTDKKYESVQVTIPADNSGSRSIEIKSEDNNATNKIKSDAPKPASIKDRLGKKIDVRSRSREDKRQQQQQSQSQSDHDKNKNIRRPYQLNSCISSISKYSDRRTTDKKPSSRRSRSIEDKSTSRKYDRSRSKSSNRNDHKRQKLNDDKRLHHHRSIDDKFENKNVRDRRSKSRDREREKDRDRNRDRERDKDRDRDRDRDQNRSRHRTRSPKPSSTSKIIEKSRSSSTESKKHKKKKKKEKKEKKKKSRG